MSYGICALSLIPLRTTGDHNSPFVSEVLYGELFEILSSKENWSFIRLKDMCEGWVENTQFVTINDETYQKLRTEPNKTSIDLVEFICKDDRILFPITIGSSVQHCSFLGHHYEGKSTETKTNKAQIGEMAFMFLNSPFRQGGKSLFGIDAAGFTQMVYQLCGIAIPRTASAQSQLGNVLSFIEETEPGDLAFFDDIEGNIVHVGIILENNHIIHAYGHVRVDRLDQTGIFNADQRTHTHQLRLIKSIA